MQAVLQAEEEALGPVVPEAENHLPEPLPVVAEEVVEEVEERKILALGPDLRLGQSHPDVLAFVQFLVGVVYLLPVVEEVEVEVEDFHQRVVGVEEVGVVYLLLEAAVRLSCSLREKILQYCISVFMQIKPNCSSNTGCSLQSFP